MEEEGFAKKGSLSASSSSSSLWASRLSPMAQPFTMKRQASQSQVLNSLTSSNPSNSFAPSTSNHLNPIDGSLPSNSFSNLVEDDGVLVSSGFGTDSPFSQYQSGSFQGFDRPSSSINEFGIDIGNCSVSTHTQGSSFMGQGRTFHGNNLVSLNEPGLSAPENLLKQDTKITPITVSAPPNLFSLSMHQVAAPPKFESSITGATFSPFSPMGKEIKVANSVSVKNVSTKIPPKLLKEDEDDLDSPCWKGIQNSGKSSGRVLESASLKSHRNQSEAGPSLNPKAPRFVPLRAKRILDSQETFSEDQLLVDSREARLKPDGYRHSNGIHEPGKEPFMLKNSKTSSACNFTPKDKLCHVDKSFRSDNNIEGFASGTMDALRISPEGFSLDTMENLPSFSSSGVGSLNDFSEILQCLSQSLSNSPNIKISMMVRAVHCMSKSLVQNYASDFDSLNDQDYEMLHDIVQNLNALIEHRVRGSRMLGLPRTDCLDYSNTSTAVHEAKHDYFTQRPNLDSEVTRSKDMVVHRELDGQSNYERANSYSHFPAKKTHDLVSSFRDACSERNGVVPVRLGGSSSDSYRDSGAYCREMQVTRTALKDDRRIDEKVQPQALLSLWIEAQAALCSMKYENHILRMKLQMTEQVQGVL